MTKATDKQREAALKKLTDTMAKTFQEPVMMTGAEWSEGSPVEVIRSGVPTLDLALGVGGLPRGRVIEIFGFPGGGKTFISSLFSAAAQQTDGVASIIDAEYALTRGLVELAGVDWNTLRVAQPGDGNKAFQMLEMLVTSTLMDVITVDSVAGLVTEKEIAGEYGQQHMAPLAQLMSQGLRKLTPLVGKSRVACIFINQIREKPGVLHGSPEYTPGGKALEFYSSVRLDVRMVGERYKDRSGIQIGHRVRVRVKKSKVAAPHFTGEFDMYYRDGVVKDAKGEREVKKGADIPGAWLIAATTLGFVSRPGGGSYYYWTDPDTGEISDTKWNGAVATQGAIMEGEYRKAIEARIYPDLSAKPKAVAA